MTDENNQLADFSGRSYIAIETEQYGSLLLRPSMLFRDLKYFQSIKSTHSPRDFTVQIVYRNVFEPELSEEEIEAWDDELLAHVAHTWATQKSPPWVIPDDLPPFEALIRGFEEYLTNLYSGLARAISQIYIPDLPNIQVFAQQFQQMNQYIQGVHQQMESSLQVVRQSLNYFAQNVIEPMQHNIGNMIANMANFNLEIGSFFDNLPDLSLIRERLIAYDRGVEVLDEGGFNFLRYHWSLSDVARFVEIGSVDQRVRNAVTTNRLLFLTRSDRFISELEQLINGSSILRRRWRVLAPAISAHTNRQYALSIPALLAQVEGMFSDALVLKNIVVRANGHLYARESNGSPRLDRRGRPIQLHGLGQKAQNSDFQNEDILQGLAEFFVDYLVPERNGILHGNLTNFARAKLSVQLLLNIYLLAVEFDYFESETTS